MATTLSPSASDFEQLPFLLRLMDDASPAVRARVATRLAALGADVWPQIEAQNLPLSPSQRHALRELLARAPHASTPLLPWPEWLNLASEIQKVEAAFCWLSEQNKTGGGALLSAALDDLTHEYLHSGGIADPEELAVFLFQERAFRGAAPDEYYDPANCDLLEVLRSRHGLPISLAAIFILVGARLDITIYGCAFPGHFLARAPIASGQWSDEDLIFDPFNGGRILAREEVAALYKAAPHELSTPASAREIVARALRNLANAHHQNADDERAREVLDLLHQLETAA